METPALNQVITQLMKRPPEERLEMARSLTDTMNTPGWDVFTQLLEQIVTDRRRQIEWAPIAAYEEMVSRAATLRGLLTAQSLPEAVLESGDRANEELRRIVAAQEARA